MPGTQKNTHQFSSTDNRVTKKHSILPGTIFLTIVGLAWAFSYTKLSTFICEGENDTCDIDDKYCISDIYFGLYFATLLLLPCIGKACELIDKCYSDKSANTNPRFFKINLNEQTNPQRLDLGIGLF
jgi:hypothetical protein